MAGPLADAGPGVDVQSALVELRRSLENLELQPPVLQHGRHRADWDHWRGLFRRHSRLRILPLPNSWQDDPVHYPGGHYHPAAAGDHRANLCDVQLDRLDGYVATAAGATLFRQRVQRLFAAAVLYEHPARS